MRTAAHRAPLVLQDFGSYRAGGLIHEVRGRPTRSVELTPDVRIAHDPNGSHAYGAAYVQYFVPASRRPGPPVVLLHGGGLSGTCWETTPDGRPGWLQGLLAQGHEVHVVDNVERGRAGWLPGAWPGEPMARSLQEAWTLFRFGAAEHFASRTPHAGQRFPTQALETFAHAFCPRWIDTAPLQARAFGAVLERLPPALVMAHSQAAATVFEAIETGARQPAGLVLLEPSASPRDGATFASTPMCLVHGDYLDQDLLWVESLARWTKLGETWQAGGGKVDWIDATTVDGPGASHMLMMDRGSDGLFARLLHWMNETAFSGPR